ncbi:putative bifunctional diguanylate cyclase/phosphodiesterase [Aureimonas ureilytica]|uniref:putative bifunctional diguanylate cyclase/phosphodiesterase n=1 Tax=Aureimonas ureilytica TaxID=401562 RepID=UPI0003618392|nr:GGDEF domain-containing phosphodiesterase [Aureimonas ureilytica]
MAVHSLTRLERSRSGRLASLRPFGPAFLALFCLPLMLLGETASLAAGAAMIALTQASVFGAWRRERQRLAEATTQDEGTRADRETDATTGVLTRHAFLARCEPLLTGQKTATDFVLVTVQFVSIEEVNESLGYKAGDFALATIGQRLASFAPGAIAGRLSSRHFSLMLPCETGVSSAGRLDALRETLLQPFITGGREIVPQLLMGAVALPEQTVYLTQALQYADHALQKADRNDSALVLFDSEMQREVKYRRLIDRELRAAILMNELELHYQPIIDLQGTMVGVEALLRWESPSRGRISPAEFIPVAESSLLIDQLGEWVLRRACLDARDFDGLHIAVNVSASQLRRDDVVSMVARVLAETGHPAERLVLELTESVAVETTPDIRRRLAALRAMGIHIALDDFGTGFSGFDYLRHLPVDSIKIDRSYIEKLGSGEADNVLVSALASVASAMHLNVLAEGVETEEQMALAKAAGCRLFQGYYTGRPMPKHALLQGVSLAA